MDTALQRIEQWEIENPTLLERERKINSMIADYKLRGFGNCRNVVLLEREHKQIQTKLDTYNRYKNNGCREIYRKKYPGYLLNIVKKLKEKMFLISAPDPDPIVFRYVKDGVLVITFWK
jgi:hypothetical protein